MTLGYSWWTFITPVIGFVTLSFSYTMVYAIQRKRQLAANVAQLNHIVTLQSDPIESAIMDVEGTSLWELVSIVEEEFDRSYEAKPTKLEYDTIDQARRAHVEFPCPVGCAPLEIMTESSNIPIRKVWNCEHVYQAKRFHEAMAIPPTMIQGYDDGTWL